MVDIPVDIWLYIAEFIPADVLRDLYSVNRTFFDLAMNERYQTIKLDGQTNEEMPKILDCIKSSTIAQRVRSLHIYPSFLYTPSIEVESYRRSWHSRFKAVIKRFCHLHRPASVKYSKLCRKFKSDQSIRAVVDIIPRLSEITEYSIDWYNQESKGISLAFFSAMRSVFLLNLKKLTLRVSLTALCSLLQRPNNYKLDTLDTLDVTIENWELLGTEMTELKIALDLLASFIRSLSLHLQSLSISTSLHVNLSSFFDSIGYLPCLARFALSAPFDNAHIPDLSSFKQFLNTHSSTLQHLSLRPQRCTSGIAACHIYYAHDVEWSRPLLTGVTLTRLRSLEVSGRFVSGRVPGSIAALCEFADSLVSLAFLDDKHFFTYDDARVLVDTLTQPVCARLVYLGLLIRHLSPEIVELLAHGLPRLKKLDIKTHAVIPFEGDIPVYPATWHQSKGQVDLFYEEMRKRSYPNWGLSELLIARRCCLICEPGVVPDPVHEEVIGECVPMLQSFREEAFY